MKQLNPITKLLALLTELMGCKKETKITECTFSFNAMIYKKQNA